MTDTVWVLVKAFGPGAGRISTGPFDSWNEANAFIDPYDDGYDVKQISRAEWDARP